LGFGNLKGRKEGGSGRAEKPAAGVVPLKKP